MKTITHQRRWFIAFLCLLALFGSTIACTLTPGESELPPPEDEHFPPEEEHFPEGEEPFDPDAEHFPEGEEPFHPEEEPFHPEEEPPPGEEPPPPEEKPVADLAVTDLYPDNLPHGNIFVRITNNGPTILMADQPFLECFANGKRWANQPGEDNLSNSQTIIVQLGPGETEAFDTGMTIDANLFQYEVTCSIHSEFDRTHGNDTYSEVIPP